MSFAELAQRMVKVKRYFDVLGIDILIAWNRFQMQLENTVHYDICTSKDTCQPDQSLCCPPEEVSDPWLTTEAQQRF